jgi:hypothetical protein
VTIPDRFTASCVVEAPWISGCGPTGIQSGMGPACNKVRSSSCSRVRRHNLRCFVGIREPCAMMPQS